MAKTSFRQRLWELFYVFVFYCVGVSAFGLNYTKYKAAVIPFIGLVILDFCFHPDFDRFKTVIDFAGEFAKYLLLIVCVTLIVYVADTANISLIVRGMEKVFYQTLTILMALCACYKFGKRSIDLTFWGLFLASIQGWTRAVQAAGGIGAWMASLQLFISLGGDADHSGIGMKMMELHENIYTFGCLIVYYLCDGWKKHKIPLLGSLLFFLLGWKRIGAMGIALAVIFCFLMRNEKLDTMRRTGLAISIGIMAFSWFWIVFVRSGGFVSLCSALNIDLSGRQNLYKYLEPAYKVTPLFFGHGFCFIENYLAQAGDIKVGTTMISRMTALHNDILASYIQFGFIGFGLFNLYRLVDLPSFCFKHGRQCAMCSLLLIIYLNCTYLTDNTMFYFAVNIVQNLLILAEACGGENGINKIGEATN